MADAQWTAFMALVDIDAEKTDQLGQQARQLKTNLAKYMKMRFDTEEVIWLVDIINSPHVVSAVVTSLQNVANDDVAIKSAVQAVITGGGD